MQKAPKKKGGQGAHVVAAGDGHLLLAGGAGDVGAAALVQVHHLLVRAVDMIAANTKKAVDPTMLGIWRLVRSASKFQGTLDPKAAETIIRQEASELHGDGQ